MSKQTLDAALEYAAARGWKCFPVDKNKRPPGKLSWPKAATSKPAKLAKLFKDHARHNCIAVATGKRSNLLVVDVDTPDGPDTLATLEAEHGPLPPTLTQQTRNGGKQYFYTWPGYAVKNTAGKLGKNIDTRGDGGYCVIPPSKVKADGDGPGVYTWLNDDPIAAAPEWLLTILKPRAKPEPPPVKPPARTNTAITAHAKYVDKAIDGVCADVSSAVEGTRNSTLNEAACKLGNLAGGGYLDRADAEAHLMHAAARCGLSDTEARATINSGMARGISEPKHLKDPEPQSRPIPEPIPEPIPQRTPDPPPAGICGDALLRKTFEPIKWAINGILPAGLTLLAGKPKQGKSVFALNLAVAVATGGHALGCIPVDRGGVLYLALEDSERRLQSRLTRILRGDTASIANIQFFVTWPRDGGIDALEKLIKTDTRLLVIDTLKAWRPTSKANGAVYDADYDSLRPLLELANRHNLTILLIHHLRKMDSDDPFDCISGTLGLTGAADTLCVFKARGGKATLHVTGRDLDEPLELVLQSDPLTFNWIYKGHADEVRSSDTQQAILEFIRNSEEAVTPQDITDACDLKYQVVKNQLKKMVADNCILKAGRGRYTQFESN